ncbi:MAG: hypothetical protein C4540_05580 [Candidatus Omnitrophota bacterium]|nr:MAG: hypothetical protein C4540_05580 [Candidatus Omnitrophota bacterium]
MIIASAKFRVCFIVVAIAAISFLYYSMLIDYRAIDANGDNMYHAYMARTVFSKQPFYIPLINYFYRNDSLPHAGYDFPPLFSLLLGIIYKIFGENYYYGIYFNAFVASASLIPLFLIGRRLSGNTAGLIASLALSLNLFWLFSITKGLLEPLFVFCAMWATYFLFLYGEKERRSALIISAFLSGLAYLARYNGLVLVFVALIYLLTTREKHIKERLKESGILIAVFVLTVFPWLLRNYVEFHDPFMYVGKYFMWLELGVPGHAVCKEVPSFRLYFDTHTVFDFVKRFFDSARSSFPELNRTSNYFLLIVLHQAVFGVRRFFNRKFLFFYLFVFFGYLFVMLHPFALDPRHFLPFYPLLYLGGSVYACRSVSYYLMQRSLFNYLKLTILLVCIVFSLTSLVGQYRKDFDMLYRSYPFSRMAEELGGWVSRYTNTEDVIMMQYAMVPLYYSGRGSVTAPALASQEDIDNLVDRYGVTYFADLFYDGPLPSGFLEVQRFRYKDQVIKVFHKEGKSGAN